LLEQPRLGWQRRRKRTESARLKLRRGLGLRSIDLQRFGVSDGDWWIGIRIENNVLWFWI
jgi:hypothetical protein